jgi:hypothetical protein
MPEECSLEDAIQVFLRDTKALVDNPDANRAFAFMANFYREQRIKNTNVDNDEDMILLQWGDLRVPLDCGPNDIRDVDNIACDLSYADDTESGNRYWVGLTRQVYAPEFPDESEFDGEAVGMDILLFFDVIPQNRVEADFGNNEWFNDPSCPIDFVKAMASEGVDLARFGPLYKIAVEVGTVG